MVAFGSAKRQLSQEPRQCATATGPPPESEPDMLLEAMALNLRKEALHQQVDEEEQGALWWDAARGALEPDACRGRSAARQDRAAQVRLCKRLNRRLKQA
ncbi:unnamed protein product, partial [Effrenium voratum]